VSDVRSVLEGIAFGRDERITPADRLRAVEQLQQLNPTPPLDAYEQEISSWDEETLDREMDDLCAEEIAEAVREDNGRWPRLAALLRETVEERARELADRDAIEREIEAKVKERSRWLLEREVAAPVIEDDTDTPADERDPARSQPRPSRRTIPRPPGIEPEAGFSRRHKRGRRLMP
jgi:hypothetical protein